MEGDRKCMNGQPDYEVKKEASIDCARVSFIVLTIVQVIIVVIFQALILVYGGRGGPLPEYRYCLSDDLQMAIDCSEKANWTNVTIPSFGKNNQVYVGFIISLTLLNFCLCSYALWRKHLCDLITFLVINLLTASYAGIEIYEFKEFSANCEMPVARILAIINLILLFGFTIIFGVLTICMFRNCTKIAKDAVNGNENLSKYYWWYEALTGGVKLVVLVTVVYYVAWMALLLTPNNYEFGITIILVVVVLAAYFALKITIRYNSFIGYMAIAITGLLLIMYYIFKTWRFISRNCPVCRDRTNSLDNEYKSLQLLLEMCTNNSNVTLDAEIDRSIQFDYLAVFAIVNMIITSMVLILYIIFWCCLPGKTMVDLFDSNTNQVNRITTIMKLNCDGACRDGVILCNIMQFCEKDKKKTVQ